MAGNLGIVAYRCLVGGVSVDSLDFQVRWFAEEDPEAIRRLIQDDPISSYRNSDDEVVCWELVEIFAIDPFEPDVSGDEVVGFIASTQELSELM